MFSSIIRTFDKFRKIIIANSKIMTCPLGTGQQFLPVLDNQVNLERFCSPPQLQLQGLNFAQLIY